DLHCGANARVPVALFDGGYLRDPEALPLAAFRFGRFTDLPACVASIALDDRLLEKGPPFEHARHAKG
ncbi:MAG: hypothetical protein RLZZ528_1702, partial [Pseudomonadota bacterium]